MKLELIHFCQQLRINRNIVECKSFKNLKERGQNVRINRNIVECKYVL